jgi:cbb3-type cytochrome oxidase maturation protein
MSGALFLIPISLALGLAGLAAFFWSMRHNQFEDLDGDAERILIAPDTPAAPKPKEQHHG